MTLLQRESANMSESTLTLNQSFTASFGLNIAASVTDVNGDYEATLGALYIIIYMPKPCQC